MDTSYQPFSYDHLPFFLVKVPNVEEGEKEIEFHYWMHSKQNVQYDNIMCPIISPKQVDEEIIYCVK